MLLCLPDDPSTPLAAEEQLYLLRGICIFNYSRNLSLVLGLNYAYVFPVRRYNSDCMFPTILQGMFFAQVFGWIWTVQWFLSIQYVFDTVCCVYTCRRLIDPSLIAGTRPSRAPSQTGTYRCLCFVYTCRRLIDLSLNAGTSLSRTRTRTRRRSAPSCCRSASGGLSASTRVRVFVSF